MPTFGKLEAVPIRQGWPTEPYDFTPWLCEDENLRTLGEEIGISLELIAREHSVGAYSLDILARNSDTEEAVVIENQFGPTDHTHLGQLLTYAAGVGAERSGARTVIWIAERFNDPHRAALDWLNATTEPGIRFFGVEVQLWKIGESAFAPRFNVVSKPNDWQKELTQKTSVPTPTEQLYLSFWNGFYEYCDTTGTSLSFRATPRRNYWLPTSIGRSGFGVNLLAVKGTKELQCQLWIDHNKAELAFAQLLLQKVEIFSKFGPKIIFDEMLGRQSFKIFESVPFEMKEQNGWPAAFQWLKEHGEAYKEFFSPRVKQLQLD